ncbi:ornithine cyclodeaminase [Novosphingobium sp. Rr 2-17]|uniref:ornithine cyclodeaminase family protein n=1 Tax=Novosphingobium sp. Rr 2-17 TaxID=555793 RepID=UPI0002698500|nr:ornithine cyclodeaminase family protein [Novosphingobium sp. Rr 2-17]EIZ79434.1 ornithine cyclodeaminase [Novosphingobium sp. Rr 2-17]
MIVIGKDDVASHLDLGTCVDLVRDAMMKLAAGETRQTLRDIIDVRDGGALSVMPGSIDNVGFGAKLISVSPGDWLKNRPSHMGAIVLFLHHTSQIAALVDAAEVTGLRTAAASAAATDVLARTNASKMAILGTGEQAWRHAKAIARVRNIKKLFLWGRCDRKMTVAAELISRDVPVDVQLCGSVHEATASADIITTVTGATDPILHSIDVMPGTHINAVGSSSSAFCEISPELVARARFVPDYRPGILKQGGEFLRAREASLVNDDHVLEGIGSIFLGRYRGRESHEDVTIYKSIGHIVQDIACAKYLYEKARIHNFGKWIKF